MSNPRPTYGTTNNPLWKVAFACFLLAGITGTLYRLGMIGRLPWDLNLQYIRHAHSHLMFFGWAAPLPLYIFLNTLITQTGKRERAIRGMQVALGGCLLFGILSYPSFLLFGYHPVRIGAASLPLSVILSGLVMITWYVYMGSYLVLRKKYTSFINPWLETSMVMLFVCSLGAWGVALTQAILPGEQLLMKALTHFFLAVFTEGWVLFAVLAILAEAVPLRELDLPISRATLIGMMAIGAPLTFPYGIAESQLTPLLLTTARFGGLLIAAALFMVLFAYYRSGRWKDPLWIWPLGLLLVKALMLAAAALLPSEFWLADHTLRILYLHVLLLGALTLACVGWLHQRSGAATIPYTLLGVSIAILLVSLFMMTPLLPGSWSGPWTLYMVSGVTILPLVALSYEWIILNSLTEVSSDE